jgi:agmatinase
VTPLYSFIRVIIDCSDNSLALKQMQAAYEILLSRQATTPATSPVKTKSGKVHPRILTLGGDHSIVRTFLCLINGRRYLHCVP